MIGIDIESIYRFMNLFKHKNRLLQKMFNASEWEYSLTKSNPAETLTGIWCAKEAVLKAMYSHEPIFIKNITIMHKKSGEPYAHVKSEKYWSGSIKISISHCNNYATAVAIVLT